MHGLDPAELLAAWERGRHEAPLDRTLTLLSAVGPSRTEASAWDLGSRDTRLAAVLADLVGPTFPTCTDCSGCGGMLDVPVDIAALARSPVDRSGQLCTTVHGVAVPFRLPTTDDLRSLGGMDRETARQQLLARCTGRADGEISDDLAAAVDDAMAEAAPAGAVEMAVHCPDCGAVTVTALDVPALLWAEVERLAVGLIRDVHALATAYGWTEPDVLALSTDRRAAYLELAGG